MTETEKQTALKVALASTPDWKAKYLEQVRLHNLTLDELRDIAAKYHNHQSLRESIDEPAHDLRKVAPQPDLQDEAREMIEQLRWLSDKVTGDYGSELGHRALSAANLIEKLAGMNTFADACHYSNRLEIEKLFIGHIKPKYNKYVPNARAT